MKKTVIRKFHRPRLLIIGCGDVGMRLLPLLRTQFRVFAVTSQPARCAELRALGAVPLVADLDRPETLRRLRGLAQYVVHLAPPQSDGARDLRTRHVTAILPDHGRLVYVSTSGVYGDCGGALIDESRPVAPRNGRARRRVDAEQVLRAWAVRSGATLAILRVPGIYAGDRLPLRRLHEGTPALIEADDVYTNHIHADDLARACLAALWRGAPQRIYNLSDESQLPMGDYFDLAADLYGLPRPPRIARSEMTEQLEAMQMSFMSESRRLDTTRMACELGLRLAYPTVEQGLRAASA